MYQLVNFRLRDPQIEKQFNNDLLTLLHELEYTVITTVIDKLEHQRRYTAWRYDPYHYGLAVLAERYIFWLEQRNATGDVMAESRGGDVRTISEHLQNIFKSGELDEKSVIRLHKWREFFLWISLCALRPRRLFSEDAMLVCR